jgi:hypothetical protein
MIRRPEALTHTEPADALSITLALVPIGRRSIAIERGAGGL